MARKTFKKVITDPNLIEQIHPDNKKLMKLFLQDKNRKCSDATMKGYTSDLNIFFCWVRFAYFFSFVRIFSFVGTSRDLSVLVRNYLILIIRGEPFCKRRFCFL